LALFLAAAMELPGVPPALGPRVAQAEAEAAGASDGGKPALGVPAAGASSAGAPSVAAASEVPFFKGMGKHRRKVTTASEKAQRYFDQGLVFVYAFNHDEAIRSFSQAAAVDPRCAMAWWGVAYANGPHINNPAMDAARSQAAWDALGRARELTSGLTAVERDLIEALAARYADPPPEDRAGLDRAYAAAMKNVWASHPEDPDVGALYAEAMMDLRPWDLWTPDGRPQPETPEILSVLETTLALEEDHPLANHLYIHALEASLNPEVAVEAADRLRNLVPGSGHLVHMPAHIYARVGRWKDAAEANQRAIKADREYRRRSPAQGFYNIYMAHNHHFLSWAAMMQGRGQLAVEAARAMVAGVPEDFLREGAFFADGYMTIVLEALMRFGRWEEILQEPEPPAWLPITTAHRHFTRAVAYAATGRVDASREEQARFLSARERITPEMVVGNNEALHVLRIAEHMLEGEISFREGDVDGSIAELRRAVELEDSLRYNEAPDWIQPVRHTLGGILLAAGRFPEAEEVYRSDLRKNPENGWSLFGLERCLAARGIEEERRDVERRFRKAWSKADVKLRQTCLCLPDLVEADQRP